MPFFKDTFRRIFGRPSAGDTASPEKHPILFDIAEGELTAIIGAKGAGKTTICKTLCGIDNPYYRNVFIGEWHINELDANTRLIPEYCYIRDDEHMVSSLSVAENIFLRRLSRGFGNVNWDKLYHEARECLEQIGITGIPFNARVGDLSKAEILLVSIARAYAEGAKVIAIDEIGCDFDPESLQLLFSVLRKMKEHMITIFYVPYRIEEISEVADRVAVLYRGEISGQVFHIEEVSYERIINIMMGQEHNANPFSDAFIEKYRITDREREIISMISNGFSNQFIAEKLDISLGTVKNHIYNVFQKTKVRNRVELCNLLKVR
ncbi:MAG TPA: ATP-binding cassette domain-containing protein [Spirochaetota bacterium]